MHERGPAKSTEERPQLYHPSPASLPSLWDPSSPSRERRLTRKVPSQGCSIRQHLPLTPSAVGTSALQVLAVGLCGHVSTAQGPHWHCKKSALGSAWVLWMSVCMVLEHTKALGGAVDGFCIEDSPTILHVAHGGLVL